MKKIFITAIMLIAGNANAASISYFMNQSNALDDGINYAQVTITDSNNGDVNFTVDVLEDSFNITDADNFGMQSFYFNYDNALTISDSNITNLDPASWDVSHNKNAGGGFGKFNFETSGTGSSRTSSLTFTISNVNGDNANSYAIGSNLENASGEFFAAHIAGFNTTNGVTSAKFAGSTAAPHAVTTVPIPAAAWLFASGLIGLVGVSRRKA